nr:RHS repeat-associated core domain-containing protein [Sphingomonas sp. Y57]
MLRRYVHEFGDDKPLVWYEGSGTTDKRWLSTDERGSVTAITDASGAVININSYDSWGIPQSTNIGRFQYTGQTWMPEIGMYYYKARVYSPTLGRFLQTDPIGYEDGPNWYNYVGNDPVNGYDPTGSMRADVSTGSRIGTGNGGLCDSCSGTVYQYKVNITSYYNFDAGFNNLGAFYMNFLGMSYDYSYAGSGGSGGFSVGYNGNIENINFGNGGGQYKGKATFGIGAKLGRPNVYYPNGRINSGGSGGQQQAFDDLNYLAALNGILPPSNVGMAVGSVGGWSYSQRVDPNRGTYMVAHHIVTGLEFRTNGTINQTNIDIPPGLLIAPGVRNGTNYVESVHYYGQ